MRVLISGGSKNGKSFFAQEIAKKMERKEGKLYYLATMVPKDMEDNNRIVKHKLERAGWGFETIEINCDIYKSIEKYDRWGSYLLDSTTALLANEMFKNENICLNAAEKVANELLMLLDEIESIVIVSDFIYSDAHVYDELTEEYRKGLAYIDRALASKCDIVIEACFGNFMYYKGRELANEFF